MTSENIIVLEQFNNILFHKSAPANKQHANQSINQSIKLMKVTVLAESSFFHDCQCFITVSRLS